MQNTRYIRWIEHEDFHYDAHTVIGFNYLSNHLLHNKLNAIKEVVYVYSNLFNMFIKCPLCIYTS